MKSFPFLDFWNFDIYVIFFKYKFRLLTVPLRDHAIFYQIKPDQSIVFIPRFKKVVVHLLYFLLPCFSSVTILLVRFQETDLSYFNERLSDISIACSWIFLLGSLSVSSGIIWIVCPSCSHNVTDNEIQLMSSWVDWSEFEGMFQICELVNLCLLS